MPSSKISSRQTPARIHSLADQLITTLDRQAIAGETLAGIVGVPCVARTKTLEYFEFPKGGLGDVYKVASFHWCPYGVVPHCAAKALAIP